VFCGKGGARLSTQFRRAFHKSSPAATFGQFEDLVAQPDLFDGDTERDRWLAKFRGVVVNIGDKRRRA
jgi:hypothetical protein